MQERIHSFREQFLELGFVQAVIEKWQQLPSRHQMILKFLIPLVVIFWLIPNSESDESHEEVVVEAPDAAKTRVAIGLNIPGVETAEVADETDEGTKPKRISLSGNDEKEEAEVEKVVDTTAGPKPWTEYEVQTGDNLSKIFRAHNLDLQELNDLLKVEGKGKPLSQIHVGQTVRYRLTNRGRLDILQIKDPQSTVMYFRLSSGGFARSQ